MANNAQKAQIHILKDQLGLDRNQYEGMLAAYGVSSSADPDFSFAKAQSLIRTMRKELNARERNEHDQGWGKNKYEYLRPRPAGFADPKQLRKIEAMWRDLARDPSDAALANFLERQTGIREITWLKHEHAVAMICAEDAMKSFKRETADGKRQACAGRRETADEK